MRQTSRKYHPAKARNIHAVIDLFLCTHTHGLSIMLGDIPFPEVDELILMLCFVFPTPRQRENLAAAFGVTCTDGVACTDSIYQDAAAAIARIVEDAGGIERFTAVFKRYRDSGSIDYRMLADWLNGVHPGRPGAKTTPRTCGLAKKYGKHPDTLRRRRDALLLKIANEIFSDRIHRGDVPGQGDAA